MSATQHQFRVPVASPWANGSSGMQFMPQLGCQVLVDFLYGDPDRPIVIGSLYSENNSLPFDPIKNPNLCGFSSKQQQTNAIKLDDRPENGGISMQASADLSFVAGKHVRTLTKGQHRISVTDGDLRLNVSKGACHISAKQKIRLRVANSWLEINSNEIILNAKQIKLEN